MSQRPSATVPKPSTSWSPPSRCPPRPYRRRLRPRRSAYVELGGEPGGEFVGGQAGKPGDEPVRGQDDQAGVAHADEHHHAEVGRVVGAGQLARGGELVAELEAGLVAMVAVGDEDRLRRPISPCDRGVRRLVVDRPEPVDDAEVVRRLERGPVADAGLGGAEDRAFGVGIEAEDRAEVVPGRIEEGEAVGLGAGERLLVRIDPPLAERLEPDPGQEPLAGVGLAPRPRTSDDRRKTPGAGPRRRTPSRVQSLRNRAARV